jgi:hypothetical protein
MICGMVPVTEELADKLVKRYLDDPTASIERMAGVFRISVPSVRRILKSRNIPSRGHNINNIRQKAL